MILMRFTFLLLLFFAFGCSSDSESPPEDMTEQMENNDPDEDAMNPDGEDETPEEPFTGPHFTLNVAADYNTINSDDWLVIHDSEGNLLNVEPFEDGDSLTFESENPELITEEIAITLFKFNTFGSGNQSYRINTYAQVPRGTAWNLKPLMGFNSDRGELIANANLTIENVPGSGFFGFAVSTKNGGLGGGAGIINGSFQANFSLWSNDNRHLISMVDANKNRRHIFIENFPNNGILTIDYNDFIDFDEKVVIDSGSLTGRYTVSIQAFEENQTFGINEGFALNLVQNQQLDIVPPELVYLNEFSDHITSFEAFFDAYDYEIRKVGGKIQNISIPQNVTFSVGNEEIPDFNFNTNQQFNWRESYWSYSTGQFNAGLITASWTVNSSNANNIPIVLPAVLLENYPDLNLESLEYEYTKMQIGFDTYPERLDKMFISSEPIFWVGFSEESLQFNNQ